MNACIIAVGSELLTPFRVDTNSLLITERLNEIGWDVRLKAAVGDDKRELTRVLQSALGAVDLVVCTGGLGPTEDDITRDAVAAVLGVPLEVDEAIVDRVRARFARRGLTMPEINRRQGLVPRGATVIDNPHGTAPGLWMEAGGTRILLLPGPPGEMTSMLDAVVASRLEPESGGARLFRRVLKITGRSESDVDTHAQPVYGRWVNAPVPIATTILAGMGQIELHLAASAATPGAAERALDMAVRELQEALGSSVYSVDGRSLEEVVGALLRARRWRLAAAESCTGGLLLSRLTDVPGSSDYVDRGMVCYSNEAKSEWLGVSEELLAEHGAVSEPVARAMAEAVRTRAGAHVGIGITGIAGPSGGTAQKAVGTVAIAVVTEGGARDATYRFLGGRDLVKFQATQAALNMLRLMMQPAI
jgi:nicotinamide-nucleotide amidase